VHGLKRPRSKPTKANKPFAGFAGGASTVV
jgi:hypothetical protein